MKKSFLPLISLLVLLCSSMELSAQQSDQEATVADTTTNPKRNILDNDFGKFGKLKVSGYIQMQYQHSSQESMLDAISSTQYAPQDNNRFSIRRGRLKLDYTIGFASVVFQTDISEDGVKATDAYIGLQSKNKIFSGKLGLAEIPFGYELGYSSTQLESAERSRIYQSFFPGERDLGVQGSVNYAGFSLSAGVFNGTGISSDNDSRKDFAGRLDYTYEFKNKGKLSAALSYYYGSILNSDDSHFIWQEGQGYVEKNNDYYTFSKREYIGTALRYENKDWKIGRTYLVGEFLWGSEPGLQNANRNVAGGFYPSYGVLPIFERPFTGGYAMLAQTIGDSRHVAVLKYDYYDPNRMVSGDDIGLLDYTGYVDLQYSTYGVGYIFEWSKYFRIMAYYDFVVNEESANLVGYDTQRYDNFFTLRFQAKF
ncbi:MAG: hypothetical protein R3Y49_04320 [Rikenellaceae bacterium]